MKNIKRKSSIALILVLAIVISMNFGSLKAKAADQITASINIYMNGTLQATDVVTESEIGELAYGSLPFGWLYGDAYGTYEKVAARINGKDCYYFCFDGENLSLFKADFSNLTAEDSIIVYLYYKNDAAPAPIEYGTVNVNFAYSNGVRVEGEILSLTGKKGAETITRTLVSGTDGIATASDFDMSYTWTCTYNGCTWNVIFENGEFRNDFMTPSPAVEEEEEVEEKIEEKVEEEKIEEKVEEKVAEEKAEEKVEEVKQTEKIVEEKVEEVKEVKMATISVTHYLSPAAGGTMVDGVPSGAFISFTESKEVAVGSEINVNDLWYMGAGEMTVLDGSLVLYNGDTFTLGTRYMSGANVHDVAADGTMILGSDLTVTYNHTFQKRYLTVTMNYLDAETLEPVASQEVRQFLASSSLEGAAEYDVTGMTPGYYRGYKVVSGYTYRSFEGDALTGEMDTDKVINFLFDQDAPIVEEEPAEEEPVVEEPEKTEEPEEIKEPEKVEEPEKTEEPEEIKEPEETKEPEKAEEPEEIKETEEVKEPEKAEVPEEIKEPAEEIEETKEPENTADPEAVIVETENTEETEEVIEDAPVPAEAAEIVEDSEPVIHGSVVEPPILPIVKETEQEVVEEEVLVGAPMEIEDEVVPLAAPEVSSAWALVNLICVILTCLVALGMIVTFLKKSRKDIEGEQTEEQKESRRLGKFLGIIPAAIAIEVFILTENIYDPMHLTDRWTLLMIVIFALTLVMSYITRNRKETVTNR